MDYQVAISKWFHESWAIYKQHWIAFSLYTLFVFAICAIPYLDLLAFPLFYGVFIAVSNKIRYNGMDGRMKYEHFLYGYLYFVPILLLFILQLIAIFVGILFLILPGIYFMFALSYSTLIFIEFHHQKIGILGAMRLSMLAYNKHVLEMTFFLLLNLIFSLSGSLFFGIGFLITYPMSCINIVVSFRDIFSLDINKIDSAKLVLY
eukprot:TRINITY_DN8315_c0_g1_i1.p1 TRINITY_DN8315_c0_g1~~TRINITY_DN8315_c0_g1_i1.p1  ORF type:complete len:205 (-),score=76.04 TRINITY_DN8315_c0_g1_i1:3-617(-)